MNNESLKKLLESAGTAVDTIGQKTSDIANQAIQQAMTGSELAKDALVHAVDQNGDGKIDIEDIIMIALQTPGVKIKRN